jgi:hypothetical protein
MGPAAIPLICISEQHTMRTSLNLATATSLEVGQLPVAKSAGLQARSIGLRELRGHELTQVSGGISAVAGIDVAATVLKIVQGGGSVPPKKP